MFTENHGLSGNNKLPDKIYLHSIVKLENS